ncbi:MAG: FtsX-like permease family protein [bacterium]|nr:FtsX-like permease family protein [bacterium]
MNLINTILTALRALRKNKLRSALTSVGIIIGVSSVIIMIGLGNSARITVRKKVFTYGENALSIQTNGKQKMSSIDVINLKKNYYSVKYISPFLKRGVLLKHKNKHMNSLLFGVGKDYIDIKGRKIKTGSIFSDRDVAKYARHAVIGTTVQIRLFAGKSALGKDIIINDVPFRVVGVLTKIGASFSGRDFDEVVLIPYTTAGTRIWGKREFSEVYLSTHSEDMVDYTANIVRKYLRRKFGIPSKKKDNITIFTSKDKLKMANEISGSLAILLAGIASISLFVGGVGIMNIMLVSVTERTREIGIRMAIGAKKRDIMNQFLIESVTLSSAGGLIGIVLGLLVYYLIIYMVKWPFIFSLYSVVISAVFAAAVGIFFGYYPSRKASSLKPIDALKFE